MKIFISTQTAVLIHPSQNFKMRLNASIGGIQQLLMYSFKATRVNGTPDVTNCKLPRSEHVIYYWNNEDLWQWQYLCSDGTIICESIHALNSAKQCRDQIDLLMDCKDAEFIAMSDGFVPPIAA